MFILLYIGNIFDWGAQAVTEILEHDRTFGLNKALNRIESRPWLIDVSDNWLNRLKNVSLYFVIYNLCYLIITYFVQGLPHKCAVIFVDNSGVDIVLGVIPFARQLITRGTKVILCANTEPSLNDVTIDELKNIILDCCDKCSIIKNAKETNNLLLLSNGQIGPCLDMRIYI